MTMYRERETKRKRERQERIYSLPLAYTNKIRKRSLWLPREVPSLLLSLSLSSPVNQWTHKLIPLSFIIDRIFLLSLGSRTRAVLHSLFPSTLHVLTVRALLHPPSSAYLPHPYLLAIAHPIFSICPVSARYLAAHPARLNLGNRCHIYFTRYQGTPATHSTEHSHGIGIPYSRNGFEGKEKRKRERREGGKKSGGGDRLSFP